MRVALLPSAYAPAVGGVEELTRRLAHRLVDAGDEVEVWTIRHPPTLPNDDRVDGVRVRRFGLPLPALRPGSLVRFPAGAHAAFGDLDAAAREFRPDVLHVQCFSAQGAYATALAARRALPLVVSLQGETVMDDADVYERSFTFRTALRLGLRQAAAVTACSSFVLDDARRFGLAAGEVVPNGVEPAGEAEPEPFELPRRFVLGLGRLVPKKGFDLLIDAFARLAARYPDVGLVIAGDGPTRPELARRAAALGLRGRVYLPGTLSRGRVAWAMANADVFVLPSRVEPFGIVVLEALRAGRPVVVSARGGAGEIVRDGENGVVADPLDTARLAEAIERLLADRSLSQRLGDQGRRRVAAFDWARVAGRYREIYATVA